MPDDFNPGQIRAKIQSLRTKGLAGTNKGLRLGAEHLLKTSRDIVPIEEAVLENSGKVSVDEASYRAAVSYDTEYAVRQHEDLSYKHDPGRHAKYLETPMHTEADTIAALTRGAVRSEMGLG